MAGRGNFDVFALSPSSGKEGRPPCPGVDDQGRQIRRRRFHIKSRNGCDTCRRRKVKCDESRPTCSKCASRSLPCRFEQRVLDDWRPLHRDLQAEDSPMWDVEATSSGSLPSDERCSIDAAFPVHVVNLKSMQLMHHYEHLTSNTLLFGSGLWRDKVLPLAFEHKHLMHAVLLISASHLYYLQPEVARHAEDEAHHLAHALSGFRAVLSTPPEQQNADVIIACAFILLHYAWAVPFSSSDVPGNISVDVGSDNLLSFATGLKCVIQSTRAFEGDSLCIFRTVLAPDSIEQFKGWAAATNCSYDFEGAFLRRARVDPALINDPTTEDDCWKLGCGSVNAADRLVPIFHVIDAVVKGEEDVSYLMPEVQAYSLMWPGKCTGEFEKDVKENKVEALVVMLSFYACTWWLLSKQVWWVERRSRVMCEAILAFLSHEGKEWEENVLNICEYFGFQRSAQGAWQVGRQGHSSETR